VWILVNGERSELDEETVLGHWVEVLGLNPDILVIEHNGKILTKAEWDTTMLQVGDRIELLHFVGGG